MKIYILLFVILLVPIVSKSNVEHCKNWFNKLRLKKDSTCLVDCTIAPIDMNTFDCHSSCVQLCQTYQQHKKQYIIGSLSSLYPGLTPQEKALAASYPTKMLKAYQLSWSSESICSTLYRTPQIDDISDACRHFVWAALLTNEFGRNFALQVLNAHEQEETQPLAAKTMDLNNNQKGVLVAEKLIKSKRFSRSLLLKEFQQYVKDDKITILEAISKMINCIIQLIFAGSKDKKMRDGFLLKMNEPTESHDSGLKEALRVHFECKQFADVIIEAMRGFENEGFIAFLRLLLNRKNQMGEQ